VLSERIANLTEHFKTHVKDNHSRRGLIKMVSQRRRLLDYVKAMDEKRYEALIQRLVAPLNALSQTGYAHGVTVFIGRSQCPALPNRPRSSAVATTTQILTSFKGKPAAIRRREEGIHECSTSSRGDRMGRAQARS